MLDRATTAHLLREVLHPHALRLLVMIAEDVVRGVHDYAQSAVILQDEGLCTCTTAASRTTLRCSPTQGTCPVAGSQNQTSQIHCTHVGNTAHLGVVNAIPIRQIWLVHPEFPCAVLCEEPPHLCRAAADAAMAPSHPCVLTGHQMPSPAKRAQCRGQDQGCIGTHLSSDSPWAMTRPESDVGTSSCGSAENRYLISTM